MRLIDADKLRINCVCVNGICVDGRTIENAPTVKAIPIEYMKQWANDRIRENWFGDHPSVIARLIVDWEKENEKSN